MAKAKQRRSPRHPWLFRIGDDNEKVTSWAKTRRYRGRPFELTLTAEHVEKALQLQGMGNTQRCAMAVCSQDQRTRVPFAFNMIDWTYEMAYFSTKHVNGLPVENIVCAHRDDVAKLFDSISGLRKLLADLKRNGPRIVRLTAPRVRTRKPGRPEGRYDGSKTERRERRQLGAVGAKARVAALKLGLVGG